VVERGFSGCWWLENLGLRNAEVEDYMVVRPMASPPEHVTRKVSLLQIQLPPERVEQGVLVVGSWTEPQNRGTTRCFCCWWRKNLGLRKAEAKVSKAVRAPPEHVTWKVFPSRMDVFWKQ
jgi:hypothetical protein